MRGFYFSSRLDLDPYVVPIAKITSSLICTMKSLHEKCPNTEFFLVHIFQYSDWIQKNADQKKLRIWPLFTHLRIQSEYRKIRTKKTPNLDTFHGVSLLLRMCVYKNLLTDLLLHFIAMSVLVFRITTWLCWSSCKYRYVWY